MRGGVNPLSDQLKKESDGEKAARLAAFLVSARMGAEKVILTFFASEPLIEEKAEFSTIAAEIEI